ncbi:MAG: hypothetical protein V3V74_01345 [Nitrosomonadaceae bacterium]
MKASDIFPLANLLQLKDKPTLHQGQCCDCKIDTGDMRVWLCREGGGVTIEKLLDGKWDIVAGSYYSI